MPLGIYKHKPLSENTKLKIGNANSWKMGNVSSLELSTLYWKESLSLFDIAEKFDITATTVCRWFKRLKISTRTISDANKLARKQNKYPEAKDYISQGYKWIHKPDYYRNHRGYVQEHIYNWEEYHKIKVKKGFIIHHLDGNKLNNEINNLILLSRREHFLLERKIIFLIRAMKSKEAKLCLHYLIAKK